MNKEKTVNILNYLLKRDKLSIDDVLSDMEDMTNKGILEQHLKKYSIWQATDGRWKTKLPDPKKKYGKLIAKNTKANLEKCIIDYYKGLEEPKDTLKNIFKEWVDYKALETSEANANRLEWVWERYYKDSDIVNMKIEKIKTITVKKFLLDKVQSENLTNRQYKDMKSLLNMMLDYCVELEYTSHNVARNVRNVSYKKFAEKKIKEITQQVYVNDEQDQIIDLALKQYKKTQNTAYLGVCLNFFLGLRVGELIALQKNDFDEMVVKISRQEIKEYEVIDGKRHRCGYKVVNYTKTLTSNRCIPLVSEAKKYYNMIIEANENRGITSEFLFINDDGERMHDHAISNVIRRLNKKIETEQKSNHSIRKTCLSQMCASQQLTEEEIRQFAGHKDYNTTKSYYLFPTKTIDKRMDAYEKALCRSVTKCNTAI